MLRDLVNKTLSYRLAPALAVAVLCSGFHFLTLRPGQTWMDDAFMYVMQAENLAAGRPQAQTCYVPNPENPYVGPRRYPPGYPAALSLVARAGGGLEAMKALNPAFILVLLCALAFLLPGSWGRAQSAVFVGMIGFSPQLWLQKDMVYSDLLFCALLYLALLAWEKGEKIFGRFLPALTGCLCYLTYAVRPIGALLPAAFLAAALFSERRRLPGAFYSLAWFLVPALLQFLAFGAGDYSEQLSLTGPARESFVSGFAGVLLRAFASLPELLALGSADSLPLTAAASLLALVLLLSAALPVYSRLRALKPQPMDLFSVAYLLLVALLGIYDGARYILPLFPYLLFNAFSAAGTWGGTARRLARPALLCAFGLFLWSFAFKADYARAGDGPYDPPARELFSFIGSAAGPGDAVIFFKPRSMCYFTGRRSSIYPPGGGDAHFWEYFRKTGARYLVVSRIFSFDGKFLYGFVSRNASGLEKVFENRDYKVFRLKGA